MIGVYDIEKAVGKVLTDNFPTIRIRANEVVEGFDRPSFFVYVTVLNRPHNSPQNKQMKALVSVRYFTGNDTKAINNSLMHDKLYEAFGMLLPTIDPDDKTTTYLDIFNIDSNVDDNGDLFFNFNLDFITYIDKVELASDYMKHLEMEYEWKQVEKRSDL